MDLAQVVEEAVISGAAVAAKAQASTAMTGALTSLREALRRAFASDPIGRTAVEKLQDAPDQEIEAWREQLRSRLRVLPEAGLRELIMQAQAVLALSDPPGSAAGRYAVTAEQIGAAVAGNVDIRAEDHSVAGWSVGNVSLGGPAPGDPPVPGRSHR